MEHRQNHHTRTYNMEKRLPQVEIVESGAPRIEEGREAEIEKGQN